MEKQQEQFRVTKQQLAEVFTEGFEASLLSAINILKHSEREVYRTEEVIEIIKDGLNAACIFRKLGSIEGANMDIAAVKKLTDMLRRERDN